MEFFIGWIILSFAVGFFAAVRRNRNGLGWFVLALLISPPIAFIFVAICRPLTGTAPKRNLQEAVTFYVDYATKRVADAAGDLNALRALDAELQPMVNEIATEIEQSRLSHSNALDKAMANTAADAMLARVVSVGKCLREAMIAAGENPARWRNGAGARQGL